VDKRNGTPRPRHRSQRLHRRPRFHPAPQQGLRHPRNSPFPIQSGLFQPKISCRCHVRANLLRHRQGHCSTRGIQKRCQRSPNHLIKRVLLVDVDYIIHVASPFRFNVSDFNKDLYEPAIRGTTGILKEAIKEKSVKRVVITSSFGAVNNPDKFELLPTQFALDTNRDRGVWPGHVYTGRWPDLNSYVF